MKSLCRLLVIGMLSLITAFSVQGQCGNNNKNGTDEPCDCPPVSPGTNKFHPYTGNVHREIRDLEVWGAVGEIPLVWMRYGNSRQGSFIQTFGDGYFWNGSFQYTMFDAGNAQVIIHYPEGGENVFTQSADPKTWLPLPGVNKRLFQEGNNFFLQMANGHRYRFERLLINSGTYYQLQDILDNQQNLYRLSYDARRRLVRVTEPAGRYLEITYGDPVSVITKVASSDGRMVHYNYDNFDDGLVSWIRLVSVDYGDGTQALYTYSQNEPGSRPNLETAIDPRYVGDAVNMKYVMSSIGFVQQEKNGVTGQVMATLDATTVNKLVCYPNGRLQNYKMPEDQLGLTNEYTDGLGRNTRYTYDNGGIGFIISQTDQLGRVTTYKRTVYGNPLEITYPDGSTEKWTRDDLDLVLTNTDELGHVITFTRDASHRVTRMTYPDGTTEQFTYNGFGQVLSHTLQNGGVERSTYDSRGLKTSFADALSNVTRYTYDGTDRVSSVTDPRGNTTSYSYNERGLTTTVTNPDGSFQTYAYDNFGNRVKMTNEIGNSWSTAFDEFRRAVTRTDPLNRVTTYNYALPGGICGCSHENKKPTLITLPGGKATGIEYDVEWQKIRQVEGVGSPDEATTFYEYDQVGNLLRIIDPHLKKWSYEYDLRDRQVSTADPLNNRTQWTHDKAGNISTVIRPDNGIRVNQFDNMNRLTQATDAKGQVTKARYDSEGNMVELTDANNHVYSFQYDLLDRRTKTIFPGGKSDSYAYDAVSNLVGYTNRAGDVSNYTYDNRNRETNSGWSDNTPAFTRVYDAAGRLLRMSSTVSVLTYTYDNSNQLTSETQAISGAPGGRVVNYTYTSDGLRNTIGYSTGNLVSYGYTGRNQLASISVDGASPLARYSYDFRGNRLTKALENGTVTSYTYDDGNRPLTLDNMKGTVSFSRLDYGYDNMDRTKFVKRDNNRGDIFSYDAADQVTSASYEVMNPDQTPVNPVRSVNYGLDPVGNRTTMTDNSGITSYTTNTENQYATVGGTPLTYNINGDLNDFNGYVYTYDAQDRLILAQKGAETVSFSYDANNRVAKRTINGTATFFYYDGWNLIEEINSNSSPVAQYIHGAIDDEILKRTSQAANIYYHHDVIGSVLNLTNVEGSVIEKYEYDVFGAPTIKDAGGNIITTSAFGNRFMFTGREFIREVGLYDYRNRMYSAQLGRFIQMDPIRFYGGDVNLYRYALNNPVDLIDAYGLQGGLAPLTAGKEREDFSRKEFEKKISPNGPVPREVSKNLDRGCIGLCSAYQGLGQNYPEDAPGTDCYLTEKEARDKKCADCDKPFVFAKQGQWVNNNEPKPDPKTGKVSGKSISTATHKAFNYVTAFPATNSYAWMNKSASGWGPQEGRIAPSPPDDKKHYPHTIWCVTCIKK